MHYFPHRHAKALDGRENRLHLNPALLRERVFANRLDRFRLVGFHWRLCSVDRNNRRRRAGVSRLIFGVWGERTTLGVAEAVFPCHSRPSDDSCERRKAGGKILGPRVRLPLCSNVVTASGRSSKQPICFPAVGLPQLIGLGSRRINYDSYIGVAV